MPIPLLALALLLTPAAAQAMVCRAPPMLLRIVLQEASCLIGTDMALRRDLDGAVECRLSNPQLRIITLLPDGRFTYDDTDNDTFREGTCAPD